MIYLLHLLDAQKERRLENAQYRRGKKSFYDLFYGCGCVTYNLSLCIHFRSVCRCCSRRILSSPPVFSLFLIPMLPLSFFRRILFAYITVTSLAQMDSGLRAVLIKQGGISSLRISINPPPSTPPCRIPRCC